MAMNSNRPLPPNRRFRPAQSLEEASSASVQETAADVSPGEAPAAVKRVSSRPRVSARPPSKGLSPTLRKVLDQARSALGIVVVIAASIAVAWGIRHHVMSSPRFGVKTIRVEGTAKRTPEQVAALAGVESGKNIFRIDMEAAKLRILQDPWIEKATVTRKLPSTITIEVTEREAAAAVTIGSDVYLCTHEGELFKKIEPGDPGNLILISGPLAEQITKDRASVVKRVRGALDLLAQYERKGPNKRLPIQEIHLLPDGTARMTVGKEAVTLELGRQPYGNKITKAARVLDEVARRNAEPSVVFLDNDAHPDRVVVRMR